MVILKLTKPVNPEYECEVSDPTLTGGFHLVRPCERYKELFDDCKSIFGRLRQYYVYGETIDCHPHEDNYNSCMSYRKTQNPELLRGVIDWEQNMIDLRMKTVKQNKAWKLREAPPQEFCAPLPDFLAARQERNSFADNDKTSAQK